MHLLEQQCWAVIMCMLSLDQSKLPEGICCNAVLQAAVPRGPDGLVERWDHPALQRVIARPSNQGDHLSRLVQLMLHPDGSKRATAEEALASPFMAH